MKVDNLRMSQAASNDESAARATFSFGVTGGTATVTFTPQGVGTWRNVALNGFEIASACRTSGDFNGDSTVDSFDLDLFTADWLWSGPPGGYAWGDLNCDGRVRFEDFARFARQWLGSFQ